MQTYPEEMMMSSSLPINQKYPSSSIVPLSPVTKKSPRSLSAVFLGLSSKWFTNSSLDFEHALAIHYAVTHITLNAMELVFQSRMLKNCTDIAIKYNKIGFKNFLIL